MSNADTMKRVLDHYEQGWDDKRMQMQQWLYMWLYIDGEQNVYVDDNLEVRTLTEAPFNEFAENRFPQMMRVWLSKITALLPIPKVMAATDSRHSFEVARAASMLVRWLWSELGIQHDQLVEFGRWYLATGNAVSKFTWENNPAVDASYSGQAITTLHGDDMPGFLHHSMVSLFNIFVAPNSAGFDNSPWYIEVHPYTKEAFEELYGSAKMKKEGGGNKKINYVMASISAPNKHRKASKDDYIIVLEAFYRPTKKNPKGEYIVMTENQLLYHRTEWVDKIYIPYKHYHDLRTLHPVWGIGMFRDGMPQQNKLNELQRMSVRSLGLIANPPVINPLNSGVKIDELKPGAILTASPGAELKPMTFGNPLPLLEGMSDSTRKALADTAGQHMVSQGSSPSSSTSGRAIALLSEQDEQRLGIAKNSLSKFLREAGEAYLRMWRANMPLEVTIALSGAEFELGQLTLAGADIDSFKVEFHDSSMLMRSEAYRINELQTRLQYGAIDAKQYVLAVEGRAESTERNEHYYNARQEIVHMLKGIAVVPAWYEDHEIHFQVIVSFLNAPEFSQLPKAIQIIMDEHAKIHYQQIQETKKAAMQEQIALAQAMKAQPGEPNIDAAEERPKT